MTPMMTQYLQTKEKHPDHLLFYRLGDFYEMFFEDAKIASRELDLVLTGRDCGEAERAPMCGIPYHSVEGYIGRLVEKGYKIAICEQMEDPALAQGLVRREVVKVITPGTALGQNLSNNTKNNYLGALYYEKEQAACAFCDLSENTVHAVYLNDIAPHALAQKIHNELFVFTPSELLVNVEKEQIENLNSFVQNAGKCTVNDNVPDLFELDENAISAQFSQLPAFSTPDEKTTVFKAVSAILRYLHLTQKTALTGITQLDVYKKDSYLAIDASSRRNLELSQTMRLKEKKGTLLWALDKTCTSMGARMLRRFIEQPLTNCRIIQDRQEAVSELHANLFLKDALREHLDKIQDVERILSKILYSSPSPKDLLALLASLQIVPALMQQLSPVGSGELVTIRDTYKGRLKHVLDDVCEQIETAIDPEAPNSIKDGNVIRTGFDREVDELRSMLTETRQFLASIETREKEMTGIKNLKVSYNRVFGYYIEVTKSFIQQVPDRYIRKQTLTNCERYITEELKELEGRILSAKERIVQLEGEIFERIVTVISGGAGAIQAIAEALGRLDVYACFAHVAHTNHYVCPEVDYSDVLDIKDSRHPVVEKLTDSFFVPNNVLLDSNSNRMAIITGPNMAGKSTYMRQVALIVLMAQIGSFVPASSARVGIVDKIFTRVGASDDLSTGQSTFMMEMNEVAYILKNATKNSLILYDEIGRGTSTYDGMSIARAVLEYTAGKKIGCKTLFATHYHELSELEAQMEGVKNFNIATKKRGEDIIFLRKIVSGSADQSYGIEVAKLAGVPAEVLKRARAILEELEAQAPGAPVSLRSAPQQEITLFDQDKDALIQKLKKLDPDTMSPIEALGALYEFTQKAKSL